MRAPVAISFAMLLCSCATETEIVGPYAARLSAADIEQIRALTATEAIRLTSLGVKITGPPTRLDVMRPDSVLVTAPIRDRYSTGITFDVIKRRGHWVREHRGGVGGLARSEDVIVE